MAENATNSWVKSPICDLCNRYWLVVFYWVFKECGTACDLGYMNFRPTHTSCQ